MFVLLEFLAVKNKFFFRFYTQWIGDIFVDEFHMANVTSQDMVLHIGCGSLPTMSIMGAKNAHAKVTAIDNNLHVVKRAQRYVHKQGLSDLITVTHADGKSYPVETFDVIFIAINVLPIDTVFRHLAMNAKPQVRIICRDLGNGVIHVLKSKEFSTIFTIKSMRDHGKTHSLLIIKNGSKESTSLNE